MTKSRIHISKNYEIAGQESKAEDKNHDISKINRRDFIKFLGLSAGTIALIQACKNNPVLRNIPDKKLHDKENKINWYSTTCNSCSANCHIRVKCIDRIPVGIEGNSYSPITNGGVCTFGQASLLSLYNDNRPKEPIMHGNPVTWDAIDHEINQRLKQISGSKGKIIILSNTINSPSTLQLIREFEKEYPGTEHIVYDPISASGILNAYERCFGNRIIPDFQFHKSKVIVSFNTDFLNSWLSPAEYTHKYSSTRDIERKLDISNHIQFESVLTGTGAVADDRIVIDPSEEGIILLGIYNELAAKSGATKISGSIEGESQRYLLPVSELLWENKGRSIVLSANNDTSIQMIICGINSLLGNYGRTINIENPAFYRQGNDDKFKELSGRIENGEIKCMLILEADPCTDSADPDRFTNLLQKVETSVLLSSTQTSTSRNVKFNCPSNHFLESWNDHQPSMNTYSISQPVISPIFNTRQYQNSLSKWMGKEKDFYNYVGDFWMNNIFDQNTGTDFMSFWETTIRDGFYITASGSPNKVKLQLFLEPDARYILNNYQKKSKPEIFLFESAVFRNGAQSDNLWLKELPDPITKICYDAFCIVSPELAEANEVDEGDIIEIRNQKSVIRLPVAVIPGTAKNTIGIPLLKTSTTESGNRNNSTFRMQLSENGNTESHQFSGISFKKTGGKTDIVCIQKDQQLKKELYIKDFMLEAYFAYPLKQETEFKKEKKYQNSPHKWVMVVDLNLCTGCSSCVISCQSENNIPTVGRKEMMKNRQMQWLRVDKYFQPGKDGITNVHFLPVMCQQCDNAPCEAVCPVSATSHSLEGLNQQNYQRCIGARFCASNCPYDVRRFNFSQYYENPDIKNAFSNETGKLSINPQVSVRSRGVIEKCSFCIQRIQDAKAKAKNAGKPVMDGNVTTACQQSCPAHAIIFGDCYDKSSRVYHLIRNKRAFTLLPELNTQPSVYYLAKVRKSIFKDV